MRMQAGRPNASCVRKALFVAAAGLVVASCGSWTAGVQSEARTQSPSQTESSASTASSQQSASTSGASTDVVEQTSSANPVLDVDFPDAFVVATTDGYVAFATNSRGLHVPMATSDDLTTWTQAGDALPDLPSWVEANSVWAPSAARVGDGYVMYVTLGDTRRDRQCIFTATSDDAGGPYSLSDEPIVCASDGSIDASPSAEAEGLLRLTWKDEPTGSSAATIRSARLTADGLHLAEGPTMLVTSADLAGGQNVEAPSLVRTATGYILFFSVGDWETDDYRTGYATCTSLSECAVRSTGWLVHAAGGSGPGGLEVFTGTDGRRYAVYHTWSQQRRVMNIDGLELAAGDTPTVVPRACSRDLTLPGRSRWPAGLRKFADIPRSSLIAACDDRLVLLKGNLRWTPTKQLPNRRPR